MNPIESQEAVGQLYTIRRARLRQLINDRTAGNVAAFADQLGYSRSRVSQFLSENYNDGRSIGERAARAMEEDAGLPFGWLDGDAAPTAGAKDPLRARMLELAGEVAAAKEQAARDTKQREELDRENVYLAEELFAAQKRNRVLEQQVLTLFGPAGAGAPGAEGTPPPAGLICTPVTQGHVFARKLADLQQRGYHVLGHILHKDGEYALMDGSCRWLTQPQYQRLMHEQDGSLFAARVDHAAELRAAILQTRAVFARELAAGDALNYLESVLASAPAGVANASIDKETLAVAGAAPVAGETELEALDRLAGHVALAASRLHEPVDRVLQLMLLRELRSSRADVAREREPLLAELLD